MGETTAIAWCDHTFNPWIGCSEISPGCDHCYARTMMAERYHRVEWGDHPRARTSRLNWAGPARWNRRARQDRVRRRVFCASLADVFDNQVDPAWRHDLFAVIAATPWLDWLLLTKRPQNIPAMLPARWGDGFPNVWLGTTAENQTEAERRVPHLRAIPAVKHFLSCEPLLGQIDLTRLISGAGDECRAISALHRRSFNHMTGTVEERNAIAWVICGGESGPGARPMDPEWARSLRDQCADAGTAFFFKQRDGRSGADARLDGVTYHAFPNAGE